MSKVTVAITTTPQNYSSSQTFQGYKFGLTGQPDQITPSTSADFLDVLTGSYTATVQMVDNSGVGFGPTLSQAVSVTDPGTTFNKPNGLTVTVT